MRKNYNTPDIQFVSMCLPKSVCQAPMEGNPGTVTAGSPTPTDDSGGDWAPVRVYC